MGDVFEARDLWATQVPYREDDKITPNIVSVVNAR